MAVVVACSAPVAAPVGHTWRSLTDWSRQHEWVPFTRVEQLSVETSVGGRVLARTGVGPLAFFDPMTITVWQPPGPDGAARCELLHTGSLVRGEAVVEVVPTGVDRCTVRWVERFDLPGGAVWRPLAPALRRLLRVTLERFARWTERSVVG